MIIGMYVTDRCNVRCFYCRPRGLEYDDKGDMQPEVAAKVAALYPKAKAVRLTGHGEPTVSKHLPAIIHEFRHHNTCLVTNGTLLHKVDADWSELNRANVSISESNKADYEESCGFDRFDQVVSNVQLLRRHKVQVALSFILHMQNLDRMEAYGKLAKNLGLRGVQFQPIRGFGDPDTFWFKYALQPIPKTVKALREGLRRVHGLGIAASMPRLFDRENLAMRCRQLSMYMAVGPEGFVAPCLRARPRGEVWVDNDSRSTSFSHFDNEGLLALFLRSGDTPA